MTTPDAGHSVAAPKSNLSERPALHTSHGDFLAQGLTCLPSSLHADDECAICLLPYHPFLPPVRVKSCGHVYHRTCISTWLDTHSTCPMCRAKLFRRTKWRITYCLRTITESGSHGYDERELDRLVECTLGDTASATWMDLRKRDIYRVWAEYDEDGRRLRYGEAVGQCSIVSITRCEPFGNSEPFEDYIIHVRAHRPR